MIELILICIGVFLLWLIYRGVSPYHSVMRDVDLGWRKREKKSREIKERLKREREEKEKMVE